MVNLDNLTKWFLDRKGQLTYSMYGSRNGTDGTADCSGSISTALKSCGFNINGLPSTVTLGAELAKNGFKKIAVNQDWNAQKNDIVLMSWGDDMSSSGGSGGHVGVMLDSENFISVDYWTRGQKGTAVHQINWNSYVYATNPNYTEVWRYSAPVKKEPERIVEKVVENKQNAKILIFDDAMDGFKKGGYYLFNFARGTYNWIPNPEALKYIRKQFPNIQEEHTSKKYPVYKRYIEGAGLVNIDK